MHRITENRKEQLTEAKVEAMKDTQTQTSDELDDKETKWLLDRQVNVYIGWIGLWLVSFLGLINILTNQGLFDSYRIPYIIVLYALLVVGVEVAFWRTTASISYSLDLVEQAKESLLKTKLLERDRLGSFICPTEKKIRSDRQKQLIVVQFLFFAGLLVLAFYIFLPKIF